VEVAGEGPSSQITLTTSTYYKTSHASLTCNGPRGSSQWLTSSALPHRHLFIDIICRPGTNRTISRAPNARTLFTSTHCKNIKQLNKM